MISQRDKKIGIALLTDEKNLGPCGAMIINILEKIPQASCVHVLHGGLSEKSRKALKKIDERVHLECYEKSQLLAEFPFLTEEILNSAYFKLCTYLTSVKFKIFGLLEHYDQVIFFDTDMLLTDDIDELINMEEVNVVWRADRQTIGDKLKIWGYDLNRVDPRPDYADYPTPNGGFLILNKNFDYEEAFRRGSWFYDEACKRHPACIAEPSWAYIAYSMNLKIEKVDPAIYNAYPPEFNSKSRLLHFLSQTFKPWKSDLICRLYPEWRKNLIKFSALSGEKLEKQESFKESGEILMADTYNKMWLNIISRIVIPPFIQPQLDLNSDTIRFYFNSLVYIAVRYEFWTSSFNFKLKIANALKEAVPGLEKIIKESEMARNGWSVSANDSCWELWRQMRYNDLPGHFSQFCDLARQIAENISGSCDMGRSVNGTLKSYFGKFVCLKGARLVQDVNPSSEEVVRVSKLANIAAIRSSQGDYISYISSTGEVAFSKEPSFFATKGDETIEIETRGMHVSARNNAQGSVQLVKQARSWEIFRVERFNEPAHRFLHEFKPDKQSEESHERCELERLCQKPLELRGALERSGLFDSEYYLEKYPDVAASGMDPLLHYASFGWREGRKPAPWFDIKNHISRFPDIDFAQIDPFYHHLVNRFDKPGNQG